MPAAVQLRAAVVALLALGGCGGGDAGAGARPELAVSAVTSLKTAFTAYVKGFEDGRVRASFADPDALAAQLRSGPRPDVVASVSTDLPAALHAEGLVLRPVRFASDTLVLAVRAGTRDVRRFDDVRMPGARLAIASPALQVGAHTHSVLDRLPRAQRRQIRSNVRSEEPAVAGIVGKLERGTVDAGFVYRSDVLRSNGALEEIELPAGIDADVEYSVAIVAGSRRPLVAKAFVYDLLSDVGRAALGPAGLRDAATGLS